MMKKEYIQDFKKQILEILSDFNGKKANIFISGGSLLQLLDNEKIKNLETKNWTIYFVDERVTDKIEDLNYVQAECFFQHVNSNIIALIDENIQKYIELFVNGEADLALFGIGEDGHIASLFPNHKQLNSKKYIINIDNSPKPPPKRLSISIKAVNQIKQIYFFVPPKNGIVKNITEPHQSILEKIIHNFTIFLAKQ